MITAAQAIADLDAALKRTGEDIILRRVAGVAPNQVNTDVTCKARVDAMTDMQVAAGIMATDLNVIISPTQIGAAQWPGTLTTGSPPFDVDQSVPRAGVTDKVLMRGQPPRAVVFVDPKYIGGRLVRINLRVSG